MQPRRIGRPHIDPCDDRAGAIPDGNGRLIGVRDPARKLDAFLEPAIGKDAAIRYSSDSEGCCATRSAKGLVDPPVVVCELDIEVVEGRAESHPDIMPRSVS